MLFWNKNKAEETTTVNAEPAVASTLEPKPASEPEPPEEWIWVEGYKGTKQDMKAQHEDYQYAMNTTYYHTGQVEECKSGFHLCLNIKDVLAYYSLSDGHRFFRVQALVRKKDYEAYGITVERPYEGYYSTFMIPYTPDKLVAKEIRFIEEIPPEAVLPVFYEQYPNFERVPQEFEHLIWENNYVKAVHTWKTTELVRKGFSPAFVEYIGCDDELLRRALAIADETDVSMDVKVLFIVIGAMSE